MGHLNEYHTSSLLTNNATGRVQNFRNYLQLPYQVHVYRYTRAWLPALGDASGNSGLAYAFVFMHGSIIYVGIVNREGRRHNHVCGYYLCPVTIKSLTYWDTVLWAWEEGGGSPCTRLYEWC